MRHQIEHDKKNLVNLDSDDVVLCNTDAENSGQPMGKRGPTLSGVKRSLN